MDHKELLSTLDRIEATASETGTGTVRVSRTVFYALRDAGVPRWEDDPRPLDLNGIKITMSDEETDNASPDQS